MSRTTLGTYAAELAFLAAHPDLAVTYLSFLSSGGISVVVDTPNQVAAWAYAIDAETRSAPHEGTIQHTTHRFDPFYVTVMAIVPADEVTA